MKHLKAKKIIFKSSRTTKFLALAAFFVISVLLMRPLIIASTSVHMRFVSCTALADRGLQAKPNRTFHFRVTTETDDTFLMEDFGIKQPMKAGQTRLFAITPTESKWYGFKLKKCQTAGGAFIALKPDGTLPGMGPTRYMDHNHRTSDPQEEKNSPGHHH